MPPPSPLKIRRDVAQGMHALSASTNSSPTASPSLQATPGSFEERSEKSSAAQRQAAQRFSQPRAERPAASKPPPPPLIGSEDFYKHKQAGIKHARMAYNAKVDSHFDSLRGGDRRSEPAPPADQIGSVAHERASRHVADINQYVASEP